MAENLNLTDNIPESLLPELNRIKEILKEKGITQVWLSKKLGKSYNMVNSYVQNRRQPSIEILNDIAIILNVNIKDLLS
jgi:transcriptional regulator with XRE-family HTH domain